MRIITRRDVITAVPQKWANEYENTSHRDIAEITRKLKSVDAATCAKSVIDNIIGNPAWTLLRCDECGTDVEKLAQFGPDTGYDEPSFTICLDCLLNAANELSGCATNAKTAAPA